MIYNMFNSNIQIKNKDTNMKLKLHILFFKFILLLLTINTINNCSETSELWLIIVIKQRPKVFGVMHNNNNNNNKEWKKSSGWTKKYNKTDTSSVISVIGFRSILQYYYIIVISCAAYSVGTFWKLHTRHTRHTHTHIFFFDVTKRQPLTSERRRFNVSK